MTHSNRGSKGAGETMLATEPARRPALLIRAWRHVWKYHGRGLSTSVGIHTRQLLVRAWLAGYRAGKRS